MPLDTELVHVKPDIQFPRYLHPDWSWLLDSNHSSLIIPLTEGHGGRASCAFQNQDLWFTQSFSGGFYPLWRATAAGMSVLALDIAGPTNWPTWRMTAATNGRRITDRVITGSRTWFAIFNYDRVANEAGGQVHTLVSMGGGSGLFNRVVHNAAPTPSRFEWQNHDLLNSDLITTLLPHGDTSAGETVGVAVGTSNGSSLKMYLGDATNPGPSTSMGTLFGGKRWTDQELRVGSKPLGGKGATQGWHGDIFMAGFCNFAWTDEQVAQLFRDPFGMLRQPVELPESFPEGPDPGAVYADARERLYTGGPDCRLYTTDARERALTDEARARPYTDEAPERLTTDDAREAGKP